MTTFVIQPQTVQIWSLNLSQLDKEYDTLQLSLSTDEIARVERMRAPLLQRRFILTRGFLRHLLGQYLNIPPKNIQLAYTIHNKPFLHPSHQATLEFNLSHSHEIALYGFAEHPIGVDVEKVERCNYLAIAKRYFSKNEYTVLQTLAGIEQQLAFYRIWSR